MSERSCVALRYQASWIHGCTLLSRGVILIAPSVCWTIVPLSSGIAITPPWLAAGVVIAMLEARKGGLRYGRRVPTDTPPDLHPFLLPARMLTPHQDIDI